MTDPARNLTAEHERCLLGAALQNATTARELLALVQAPMIADARLSRAGGGSLAGPQRAPRHPITRTIAAPVRGPDGKPARRKGGAIIRSATERIDNPAAHLAGPPLSEADLTRMIGFDPTDRYRRRDCRAAFARMEADGVIERARDGRRWLLFGGPELVTVRA